MTISLEYIGAAERYFETAATGKSQSWRRGQTQDVSDTDAALLMATGLFAYGSADAQPESNIAPGFPVMATKTLTGGIEKLIVGGVAIPGIGSHEKHSMRRLAIIGDSLTETTTGPYGSTNPVSQYRDNAFITWGLARSGVSARIVYNAGVGGAN